MPVSSLIAVMLEQHRQNDNLTAQNLQLWTEKSDLERQMGELIRERDGLNWTVGVILEYENFPVNLFCLKKGDLIKFKVFVCFCYLNFM